MMLPPGYHHSEETRQRMRENHVDFKGKNNPNFGKHLTEEHKQKLIKSHEGKHLSAETKRKLSKINKGHPSPMQDKHHTEEARRKISDSRKGKPLSEEHKRKLSEAGRGRYYSEETKQKISDGNKGKNLGRHASGETRKKMSVSKKNKPLSGKALEHILEVNARKKGKPLSKEHKKKISNLRKERPEIYQHLQNRIIKNPSKPQLKLFEVIKSQYPNKEVAMNHRVKTKEGYRFIDVAIPKLMLGWEFDGKYWHKDRKEKDLYRHQLIENDGWKLIHYSDESEFC